MLSLSGDWLDLQVIMGSITCPSIGPASDARARARLRAVSYVFPTIEKSPRWPGSYSELLAVTDLMSNLTWVWSRVSHVDSARRARAAERGEFCIARSGEVVMLALKIKCTPSGDRWELQVSMGSITCQSTGSASDARARGCAG